MFTPKFLSIPTKGKNGMFSSEGTERHMGEELSQFPLVGRKRHVILKSMFKEV